MISRITLPPVRLILWIGLWGLCALFSAAALLVYDASINRVSLALEPFTTLTALWISFVALLVFSRSILDHRAGRAAPGLRVLILTLAVGTVARAALAVFTFGNFDMQSYHVVAHIMAQGDNVYQATTRYNYSPVWFLTLDGLNQIGGLPLFVLVRLLLTGVDLLTVLVVLRIATHEGQSGTRAALFFFLNPASILLTGYHGQFENVTVLLLLTGVLIYLTQQSRARGGVLWISATLALIVKHNIAYQLVAAVRFATKRRWLQVLLFGVSVLLFLAVFLPYASGASDPILRQVLIYKSITGWYGITSLVHYARLYYVFVVAIFLYQLLLDSDDLIDSYLLGFLFFLAFTTGMGPQYLVLPIALGALRLSRGFLLYSALASAYLLGSNVNVYLPGFRYLDINLAWLAAVYWFVTMHMTITVAPRLGLRRLFAPRTE